MFWIWILLVLASLGAIAVQDFRQRLISVWLLICFGLTNLGAYFCRHSYGEFLENALFCLCYFLFSYLLIHLFYFLKTGKFQKMLDEKIGWGDVWFVLAAGCCMDPVNLTWFFTAGFIVALTAQLLFFRKEKTIPLAGMLSVCYIFYLIFFII